MDKTEKTSVLTKRYIFYKAMLFLYPDEYRRKFENEMLITFEEMYQEKMVKEGKGGFLFWSKIVYDLLESLLDQHKNSLKKNGLKKYLQNTLHFTSYHFIGIILLLPFSLVFLTDIISRIVQGDLVHYNRPVYNFLSHTLLYWKPVLFIWVILFPAIAVILNLIPLIRMLKKSSPNIFTWKFLRRQIVGIILVILGFLYLSILGLHDFLPCAVHGIVKTGIGHLPQIFLVCRNA